MLNYIWAGMILLGVIYGVCTGQMSALTGGALDSAREQRNIGEITVMNLT